MDVGTPFNPIDQLTSTLGYIVDATKRNKQLFEMKSEMEWEKEPGPVDKLVSIVNAIPGAMRKKTLQDMASRSEKVAESLKNEASVSQFDTIYAKDIKRTIEESLLRWYASNRQPVRKAEVKHKEEAADAKRKADEAAEADAKRKADEAAAMAAEAKRKEEAAAAEAKRKEAEKQALQPPITPPSFPEKRRLLSKEDVSKFMESYPDYRPSRSDLNKVNPSAIIAIGNGLGLNVTKKEEALEKIDEYLKNPGNKFFVAEEFDVGIPLGMDVDDFVGDEGRKDVDTSNVVPLGIEPNDVRISPNHIAMTMTKTSNAPSLMPSTKSPKPGTIPVGIDDTVDW
jgi:hypothetical protein